MHSATDTLFLALSDPTRRAILERIAGTGEQSVHALTGFAGVAQPTVSKHLAILKRAGLVVDRRAGRETIYRLRPAGLVPLTDWMKLYGIFWEQRFDAIEDLLKRIDQ